MKFTKMSALGNDFIVINALKHEINLTPEKIKKLSDRHDGIGFDQLLLLTPSPNKEIDYGYVIYNADGSEVDQCGNGARAIACYISSKKLSDKRTFKIATRKATMVLKLLDDENVSVNMGIPEFEPTKIPLLTHKKENKYTLTIDDKPITFGAVSLGNPHAIIKVPNAEEAPVESVGKMLQAHSSFPERVNVGFMQIVTPEHIRLRVYERGAGETRACGSGACAAMVIGHLWSRLADQVTVELPGGNLLIEWQGADQPVWMTGPAHITFEGEIEPSSSNSLN